MVYLKVTSKPIYGNWIKKLLNKAAKSFNYLQFFIVLKFARFQVSSVDQTMKTVNQKLD